MATSRREMSPIDDICLPWALQGLNSSENSTEDYIFPIENIPTVSLGESGHIHCDDTQYSSTLAMIYELASRTPGFSILSTVLEKTFHIVTLNFVAPSGTYAYHLQGAALQRLGVPKMSGLLPFYAYFSFQMAWIELIGRFEQSIQLLTSNPTQSTITPHLITTLMSFCHIHQNLPSFLEDFVNLNVISELEDQIYSDTLLSDCNAFFASINIPKEFRNLSYISNTTGIASVYSLLLEYEEQSNRQNKKLLMLPLSSFGRILIVDYKNLYYLQRCIHRFNLFLIVLEFLKEDPKHEMRHSLHLAASLKATISTIVHMAKQKKFSLESLIDSIGSSFISDLRHLFHTIYVLLESATPHPNQFIQTNIFEKTESISNYMIKFYKTLHYAKSFDFIFSISHLPEISKETKRNPFTHEPYVLLDYLTDSTVVISKILKDFMFELKTTNNLDLQKVVTSHHQLKSSESIADTLLLDIRKILKETPLAYVLQQSAFKHQAEFLEYYCIALPYSSDVKYTPLLKEYSIINKLNKQIQPQSMQIQLLHLMKRLLSLCSEELCETSLFSFLNKLTKELLRIRSKNDVLSRHESGKMEVVIETNGKNLSGFVKIADVRYTSFKHKNNELEELTWIRNPLSSQKQYLAKANSAIVHDIRTEREAEENPLEKKIKKYTI